MATKRPSFLKRQKEMKRNARALEKREARRARKERVHAEPQNSADPGADSVDTNEEPAHEPDHPGFQ
jgi:hypothetical protein